MTDLAPKFWTDDTGQDIAEYAVMLAVILVLVVGTIRLRTPTTHFPRLPARLSKRSPWSISERPKRRRGTMSEMRVELSCKICGNVFSIFVREAAEQNGKITCPACGQMHEYRLADIRKLAA